MVEFADVKSLLRLLFGSSHSTSTFALERIIARGHKLQTAVKETTELARDFLDSQLSSIEINLFWNTIKESVFTCCDETEMLYPNPLRTALSP